MTAMDTGERRRLVMCVEQNPGGLTAVSTSSQRRFYLRLSRLTAPHAKLTRPSSFPFLRTDLYDRAAEVPGPQT